MTNTNTNVTGSSTRLSTSQTDKRTHHVVEWVTN